MHERGSKVVWRDVPGLTFHSGIPREEDLDVFTNGSQHCIVVLDDLMEEVVCSVDAQNLFTKYSHHKQISVIFIKQNMYPQGKCMVNVSLNYHYIIALCNPRDVRQINVMADQTGLGQTLKETLSESQDIHQHFPRGILDILSIKPTTCRVISPLHIEGCAEKTCLHGWSKIVIF